jgi:hypothetical protein
MNVNLLKIALLFFVLLGFFISCNWDDDDDVDCSKEIFNNKMQFGKYTSKEYLGVDGRRLPSVYIDTSSLNYMMRQFSFYGDSSFSYSQIRSIYSNVEHILVQDTITMLSGKFKINEDPGLPWYILELNVDSIYKSEFEGFKNKFFKSVDKNGCFTLHEKWGYLNPEYKYSCFYKYEDIYWYLPDTSYEPFCLEQPEEEFQPNSAGDES